MSMSVGNSVNSANFISAQPVRLPSAEREAFNTLGKSLRAGNLDTAKSAYADMIRQAPDGASFKRGSPFADIGKALHAGDVDAAKSAFGAMVRGARGTGQVRPPEVSLPPVAAPVASTTGGIAGGTVSVVV